MRRISALAMVIPIVLLGGFAVCAQEAPPAPAPAPAPAPTAAAPSGPPAPVVEMVKIVIDNKAKTDGEIRFAFTPAGGAAKEVRVTVAKGMSESDICRDVAKELTVALGPEYEVDQYDPDKVKVEGKKGEKFSLTLAGQTVGGTSIELK